MYVPVLEDEVVTSDLYIYSGNFLPWHAYPDANNHILNSFLAWISVSLFGKSLFYLRLPGVLSFVLYIISVIGISRSIKNKYLGFLFVTSLLLTQGFIEFFGYCRGYGLSMALVMASVWMVLSFERSKVTGKLMWALLFNVLSVTANLNLLPTSVILFSFIILLWFRNARGRSLKASDWFFHFALILSLVVFVVAVKYSFMLQSIGKLYYGADIQPGFYESVVKTNVFMLYFAKSGVVSTVIVIVAIVAFLLFTFDMIVKRLSNWFSPSVTLFPALFIGNISAILILHHLLNINYPEDRTSIYLFPWFVGFVFFTVSMVSYRWIRLIILPFLLVPVSFVMQANITHSLHWWYEHYDESFVKLVKETSGSLAPGNVTICSYKVSRNGWSYFVRNSVPDVNLINPVNNPNNFDDYQLLKRADIENRPEFYKDYKVLAYDEISTLTLLMRQPRLSRELIFERKVVVDPVVTSDEFFSFQRDTIFDIRNRSLVCDFIFEPDIRDDISGCYLIVTVWDSLHVPLQYHSLNLNLVSDQTKPVYNYSVSVINIPPSGRSIVAYLYNPRKETFRLKKAVFRMSEFIK